MKENRERQNNQNREDEAVFRARRIDAIVGEEEVLTPSLVEALSQVPATGETGAALRSFLVDQNGRPLVMSAAAAGFLASLFVQPDRGGWGREADVYTALDLSYDRQDDRQTLYGYHREAQQALQKEGRARTGERDRGPWIVKLEDAWSSALARQTLHRVIPEAGAEHASIENLFSSKYILQQHRADRAQSLSLPEVMTPSFLNRNPDPSIRSEYAALMRKVRLHGMDPVGMVTADHVIGGMDRLLLTRAYLSAAAYPRWQEAALSGNGRLHRAGIGELNERIAQQGSHLVVESSDGVLSLSLHGSDPDKIAYWMQHQANEYHVLGKELFVDRLRAISLDGRLGKRVMDVGCGPKPVTDILPQERHERVLVDWIDWPQPRRTTDRTIRADITNRQEREQIVRGVPPVDSLVFASSLNYCDYRAVVADFSRLLRPGGRCIIFNQPGFGAEKQFDEAGRPKGTHEVVAYLQSLHYRIEEMTDMAAVRVPRLRSDDENPHLIIAQKMGERIVG